MNPSTLVVKQENDIDTQLGTYFTCSPLGSCEIKQEVQFQIKTEPAEAIPNNANLDKNSVNSSRYPLHAPQLVESFVIYELETSASTTGETSATKVAAAATTKQFQHQPPILLNAKLRKRPRMEIPSASSASIKPQPAPVHKTKKIYIDGSSIPTAIPTSTTELKVKCFCRLGNPGGSTQNAASITNGHELKGFFEQMFNETRQLTREQQRVIKMELLEAICEAEGHVEEGKSCDKCCES